MGSFPILWQPLLFLFINQFSRISIAVSKNIIIIIIIAAIAVVASISYSHIITNSWDITPSGVVVRVIIIITAFFCRFFIILMIKYLQKKFDV